MSPRITAASRGRVVVSATLLALAAGMALALLLGSHASAACTINGYGQKVCTKPPANKHFLKVKPKKTRAGKTITAYGNTGAGCPARSTVSIYSAAFKGVAKPGVGNVPTVFAKTNGKHAFSKKIKLSGKLGRGTYVVSGRCGGGRFGSAKLKVT